MTSTHSATASSPPYETSLVPGSVQSQRQKTQSASQEGLKDIAFGSFAGAVGKVVEYPFDTVKVRLQSQSNHLPLRYGGPLDCFRQSLQADGVRSLYRGLSAPLFGAAAETACLFYTYGIAQGVLSSFVGKSGDESLPLSALVTAGAMAGGVTSFVLTPIELVKCRVQVPSSAAASVQSLAPPKSLSVATVIKEVFRREGLRGFWRGQLGTFLRETGGTAAWFGSYEAGTLYFKQRRLNQLASNSAPSPKGSNEGTIAIKDVELPIANQMTAGALAGMAYNFLFFPADTIKSKIQTSELSSARQTFLSVGKELYRAHGLKGLYRGCGITVARSAPSSALIFTIVENLKKAFA